jgi:hypothetical protein
MPGRYILGFLGIGIPFSCINIIFLSLYDIFIIVRDSHVPPPPFTSLRNLQLSVRNFWALLSVNEWVPGSSSSPGRGSQTRRKPLTTLFEAVFFAHKLTLNQWLRVPAGEENPLFPDQSVTSFFVRETLTLWRLVLWKSVTETRRAHNH